MSGEIEKALEMLASMLKTDDNDTETYNEISDDSETVLSDEADLSEDIPFLSGSKDKRVSLLSSIKPYMSGKRQEKVDVAINVVKLLSFSSALGLGNLFDIK